MFELFAGVLKFFGSLTKLLDLNKVRSTGLRLWYRVDREDVATLRRVERPNSRYVPMNDGVRLGDCNEWCHENTTEVFHITERLARLLSLGYVFQNGNSYALSDKGRTVLSAIE